MADQPSVLVADAHALSRGGIASMVRDTIPDARISETETLSSITAILEQDPDIVLAFIAIELLELNELPSIPETRRRFPHLRVVLTDEAFDREVALSALSHGCHGYLPKSSPRDELMFATRSVFDGRLYYPRELVELNGKEHKGGLNLTSLSSRQLEVLKLLASGMANKEIARELHIAEGTVKVHLNAAFKILGVHNRAGAVTALHEHMHS